MLDFLAGVTVISVIIDWGGGGYILGMCVWLSRKTTPISMENGPKSQQRVYMLRSQPGGGGYSEYILVGVSPGTPKKGGLRCGHSPKRGVLGAGTAQKKGVLGAGTTSKRGGLI